MIADYEIELDEKEIVLCLKGEDVVDDLLLKAFDGVTPTFALDEDGALVARLRMDQ